MKYSFTLLLFCCFFAISLFAQTDTISVYYKIGSHIINEEDLEQISIQAEWEKVSIISYTDYLGSEEFNNKLSYRRAREARSRLIEKGLRSEQLNLVEGRGITGETLPHKEGIQDNRRTDIIIWEKEEAVEVKQVEEEKEVVTEEDEPVLSQKVDESEIGDHLVLEDLIFIPGQHVLIPAARASFFELVNLLKKNPSLKINIEGHICCNLTGDDGLDMSTGKYNLSEARAEYIYNLLIEEGISKERLSYEGFARSQPIYPDEITEEEKQANRRVEIKILEK